MCGFSATPRRNAELNSRSWLRDFERDSESRRYPTVKDRSTLPCRGECEPLPISLENTSGPLRRTRGF
ncbi:hypothetical protein C5688_20995 [Methylocystis sp. MitZ-2018]|nr:hypothetical protein C5688_20995 [Methylocystis sp. MitZ-2018]